MLPLHLIVLPPPHPCLDYYTCTSCLMLCIHAHHTSCLILMLVLVLMPLNPQVEMGKVRVIFRR